MKIDRLAPADPAFLVSTDLEREEMGKHWYDNPILWPAIAREMMAVYNWLAKMVLRPGCIQIFWKSEQWNCRPILQFFVREL